MSMPEILYCPGTLAAGYSTYSPTCIRRVFNGHKVSHLLPYDSPATDEVAEDLFLENRKRMSISGVQEKFSVLLEKNKLRLIREGEKGNYILKPIPNAGKNADQMPANEHLTMQIARQVYNMDVAENALIFFNDGQPAYITKRFDVDEQGGKLAADDFASLAGRTPQTHGEHFKYLGNYLDLFKLIEMNLPAYSIEALKLFKLIVFNYLFSNGDAHFKNFSLLETPQGDYRLSPAYDLINTRIHIDDSDFALDDGLLPKNMTKGKVFEQFHTLAQQSGIGEKQMNTILQNMLSNSEKVSALIDVSFLNETSKRNYLQAYQTRLKKLARS
jgi:serine/threonine-protein kinase HipA